jgi:pimeloyl-ACP methyl ester carboxylesterase
VLVTDLPVQRFACLDGFELAWREVGSGRTFVLLHGLMSNGARLAGQGFADDMLELIRAMADRIRQGGIDARAVGLVLDTFVATSADALRQVPALTLVIVGDRDSRSTSADSLAAVLPHGRLVLVPGDHVTALGAPEFTTTVLEFLGRS